VQYHKIRVDHGPFRPWGLKATMDPSLRAPRTYICNIDFILVLFVLLPSLLKY